jgi:hypothetical protein
MRAVGAKLIKVAEAYGRDILQDVETEVYVVDFDGDLMEVKDIADAFNEAGKNPSITVWTKNESKSNR